MLKLVEEVIERVSCGCGVDFGSLGKACRRHHGRVQLPLLLAFDLGDHGGQDRLDVVGCLRIVNEVFVVSIKFELSRITLIIKTDFLTALELLKLADTVLVVSLELLLVSVDLVSGLFDGVLRHGWVL